MSNRPGMLINLPPPQSDPTTPNEQGPGTPNSTTTSLSALSVVAIKDGAVGHNHNHNHGHHNRQTPSGATLEAERADRISRLAGLERVATVRQTPSGNIVPTQGSIPPQYHKEISTVGTASATGSVAGGTTWASEMDYDADKMSESMDQDEVSSTGGFSDEDKASLVAFGEGAGSTVSGPINTTNARMVAARNIMQNNAGVIPRTQPFQNYNHSGGSTPMSGIERPSGAAGSTDAKMMDGMTYDQGVVDTTVSTPPPAEPQGGARFTGMGAEVAESMMRDRLNDRDQRGMATPPNNQSLGRFGFEGEGV